MDGYGYPAERRASLYAVLCSAMVLSIVLANLAGGKLTEVVLFGHSITFSVAMFILPVGLICMNLVQELFGASAARRSVILSLGAALCAALAVSLLLELPMASVTRTASWKGIDEQSFVRVFSSSRRLMLASLTAYLASQSVNLLLFRCLASFNTSRGFALRTVACLLLGQAVDTLLVQGIAWHGLLPLPQILTVAATEYLLKLAAGGIILPFAWAGRALLGAWLRTGAILQPSSTERGLDAAV